MPKVDLVYKCPIWVTVDTDTGEVEDVQVGDESVELDESPHTDLDKLALSIAETAEWPEWRFG